MNDDTEEADQNSEPYIPASPQKDSLESKRFYADKHLEFNYDVDSAPKNRKLTLLTIGRIAIQGVLHGDARDDDILGWFPLPARNRQREAERIRQITKKTRRGT